MLRVKDKLARGGTATMVLVNYPSPALVEQLGRLGFDIAFIDCEKGSATTERIEEMCRGARAAGIAAIVRPWSSDAGLISRYLDLGADGVMVAGIDDAASAQALVDAVRYARHKDHADKLVIGMIESPAALANLPQLLAIDGIDVWFIGPNDLAHRMGFPGRADRPEVQQAVLDGLRRIAAAGKFAGTLASFDNAQRLHDAGARVLLTRATELLARGAAQFQAQLTPEPSSTSTDRPA
jgi:2-keto-3-deoxy-L-rhamnonate aldolase RhmA